MGNLNSARLETADPSQFGQPFANTASSGIGYASFLLGAAGGLQVAPPSEGTRLGMHSYGLYLQDSWKVTHTLTFELGLRWDYATLWTEEHGRMQNADFTVPNPTIGGRLGTVEYGATCNCTFAQPYPFSIGPHLGVAWQITPKTVFRAGGAINYGAGADQAGLNVSVPDFLGAHPSRLRIARRHSEEWRSVRSRQRLWEPGPHVQHVLQSEYSPVPGASGSGVVPPSSPFISIASNAARLPRIFQWSIGFQREITKDMVVEAAYVGNRGAWWTAPLLSAMNYNGVSPQTIAIAIRDQRRRIPTDQQLSCLRRSVLPLVIARFPNLANPNNVYPGFPAPEPLIAALVPYPQWYRRNPAIPGASHGRHLVRFAAGES